MKQNRLDKYKVNKLMKRIPKIRCIRTGLSMNHSVKNHGINRELLKNKVILQASKSRSKPEVKNEKIEKTGKTEKIERTQNAEYAKFGPLDVALLRGMVSYAIIWPTCTLIQEYLENGTTLSHANWQRSLRFGIFGAFFMAPLFHTWMKFSGRFFKGRNLKTALTRAMLEQVTYAPFALLYFFFGMSLLERKPLEQCIKTVKEKFWPTYRVGFFYWPTVQTLNFYLVPVAHRLIFVSFASLIWTIFMAHMQAAQISNDPPRRRSRSRSRSRRRSRNRSGPY